MAARNDRRHYIGAVSSPCFACGRCCFGPTAYVQVFDEDLLVLGPELAARLVVGLPDEGGRFMSMQAGHCAALDCSAGQFRCSIYEQRPLICRVYQLHGADSPCPPALVEDRAPLNPYRLAPVI